MELSAARPSLSPDAGDFAALLRERGLYPQIANASVVAGAHTPSVQTQATTICAFKFAGGVLVAGDRRATAGNVVVYDRADKVLEIDSHSLMAIPACPRPHGKWPGCSSIRFSFTAAASSRK